MRDVKSALAWMHDQSLHGGPKWQHKCQSSVRSALGLHAWATSARKAYEMTPKSELHYTPVSEVPTGAICYGLLNTTYGHAWLAAGNGMGYSVDYKRRGYIDLCPLSLPAWTKDNKVHWSTWTPMGHVKVVKPR